MKISKIIIVFLIFRTPLFAFQDMKDVQIKETSLSKNIYMLEGKGGNIGILIGEDGVFMIDDQFATISPKILEKIRTLSDQPVKYLVNTHHHGDHTGGNENFQKEGALILAHANVRNRLKKNNTTGLPVITFNDEMNLYLNENNILVTHVHNAHTDGDALIYFPQDNVLHTGDTFFNGMFPYIDLESGGSVDGYISAVKTGLSLINENTRIIPGHGPLASYNDYQAFLEMLEKIRSNIEKAIAENKTEEEVAADETITREFYTDAETKDAFINGPKIRSKFYRGLKK
jgi:cyclase